jgi:hypothetical protein
MRRLLAVACGASFGLALWSCGGDSPTDTTNPLPVLLTANPSQLVVGSSGTTVTLTGEAFSPAARVRWNNADRVTHVQSATTATVDLTIADLANFGSGQLSIVNPLPGGGTSGVLTLSIGLPKPTVTSVTPGTVLSGSSTATLTIIGTGFTSQSSVRVGATFVGATLISATELRATLTSSVLQASGVVKVTVSNPGPGGGTSDGVDLAVQAPLPVLTGLTPDSAITGVAFSLSVLGSGFTTTSVVRWNGTDHATTFVNSGRLTVAVTAADVQAAGSVALTVVNAAPGGGTSASLALRIRDQAPRITSTTPAAVQVGAGTTILTITGANFSQSSTVRINGVTRTATYFNASTFTTSLTASDMAQAGTISIAVVNTGSSGASNTIALPVLAASLSIQAPVVVSLKHNHVVYDNLRNRFYVSVPSSVTGLGNTITIVDPAGTIGSSVSVGSEPGRMAISDDGTYLYVAMGGSPTIVRVTLSTFTKGIEFQVGQGIFGADLAEDIEVLPGQAGTVAASRRNTCCSPRHEGVAIYDDGVMRTTTTQGHTGSDRIARSAGTNLLYGYNNETTEFGFRRILVSGTGLQEEVSAGGLISGFGVDIEFDGGRVYATTGAIVDPSTMTLVGTISGSGVVRPDVAKGRVHFLTSSQILTYNAISFTSIGTYANTSFSGLNTLIRWGSDGLAAGGGNSLVIMRGSLIGP